MMRWNFLQKKYLYDGIYKVDLFRSNSFMALFEFSTDALFIDYLLYWRLSEIEPLFKVVLKKYRKKEPTPELYFLFPQERIYTTYKWASAYVQMRNYSLKKSSVIVQAFKHLVFSEKHDSALRWVKIESYHLYMIQQQDS